MPCSRFKVVIISPNIVIVDSEMDKSHELDVESASCRLISSQSYNFQLKYC